MWPLVKIAVVGTLALIASVWILSKQGVLSDQSKPTRPKTETPRVHSGLQLASPPPTEAKPREPQIIVRDGRLTVHVHEARLRSVLDVIAEQSGVSILDNADLGSAMVSAELRDVPIDRGLQDLLARWGCVHLLCRRARPNGDPKRMGLPEGPGPGDHARTARAARIDQRRLAARGAKTNGQRSPGSSACGT